MKTSKINTVIFQVKSVLAALVLAISFHSDGLAFDFQAWAKNLQKKPDGQQQSSDKKTKSKEKSDASNQGSDSNSSGLGASDEDIIAIQKQIDQITEQTKMIERQSAMDRAQLQKVLDNVQMQKKLVDSLKTPKPQPVGSAINTDEIIRQAKVRLIAEDVKRTQETLRTSKLVTSAPKPVQPIKASER